MGSKSKITKLKKEFWDKYTEEYNRNPEAFELMRVIGVEQGEFIEQLKTAEKGNKTK